MLEGRDVCVSLYVWMYFARHTSPVRDVCFVAVCLVVEVVIVIVVAVVATAAAAAVVVVVVVAVAEAAVVISIRYSCAEFEHGHGHGRVVITQGGVKHHLCTCVCKSVCMSVRV